MNHTFNKHDVCIRCGCRFDEAVHGADCQAEDESLLPLLDIPEDD